MPSTTPSTTPRMSSLKTRPVTTRLEKLSPSAKVAMNPGISGNAMAMATPERIRPVSPSLTKAGVITIMPSARAIAIAAAASTG